MLFSLEPELCSTLWSIDLVHEGVCDGLLGEGSAAHAHVYVLMHICPGKENLQSAGGGETGVDIRGSVFHCWHCSAH